MQVASCKSRPPAQMYERPSNRYVADFLGDMNVLQGIVVKAGDTTTLETADGTVLEAQAPEPFGVGTTAWFAVRPEKLTISRAAPATANNVLAGEVWDIAYLGDLTIYKVKLDDGTFFKASQLNRTVAADDPITWEDRVWLHAEPDSALVLTA